MTMEPMAGGTPEPPGPIDVQDPQALARAVSAREWYHTIELGDGVITPGVFDLRPVVSHYGIPDRLDGKSALDVGPGDGFFAFELEKRGAKVTTIELPAWTAHDASPVLETFYRSEPAAAINIHDGLGLAAQATRSRVERRFCNVYDLSPDTAGTFDVVFCSAVLLHLTDPLRALYRMFAVTREMALISTPIDDQPSGEPRALFKGTATGHTFWLPNRTCLQQMVRAAGFTRVEWISTFEVVSTDGRFRDVHGALRATP